MGKAIAVVAIKGGVGKTTVTQNLANIYSIFEPTLALDSDKSPMTHLEFKTRIDDRNIADINGEGIDWITKPNILDFQKDCEDEEILLKNAIKNIENDSKFKNLKKADITKMANKKIGKINLLNYVAWIDNSSDFGILGGGLDETKYEAISKNYDFIKQLNKIKSTWNVFYDTQAGEHDLTFKLMDNAEKIILVSNIGAGAHVNASRMGSLYLWHKLEKSISRDKKNVSELLKLIHEDSINNTNYKHIEETVRKDHLAGINDENIRSVFKWYLEKIDKAKKETELYVLLNMVPQKGKKIGGESAETVAKWCYAQLRDAFEKNGIHTYHLGTLHESPAYRANAINRGIIPRIDFKKRSLWGRIFHPMDSLYTECYEIVEKIRKNKMGEK